MLFLAQACLGHRSQLTKITRKSASFGTLHSVTLWYEPLDRTKPLPQTKKVFNFSRSQHARILASFTTSTPRAELDATLDAHVREAAAFFAERITAFSEQKKKESPPFTCAFRMNSPIKNIAVTVRLSRTKSQKLRGNITLHGYLKEPSPELIQFIIAAVIDDAPPGWLARMSLLIALLAGWKWLNVAPPPTTKCDATIQTDYEEEIHPVQNDGCHSSGSSDGCLPPESDTKPVQEKIDIAMQTERDENKDDIDGECIPLPLHRRTIISGYNERDTMPEISIDMLYRAIFRKTTLDKQIGHLPWGRFDCARGLSSEQVCILDDGSILLTCTHGCARFIIHKNSQHLDLGSVEFSF